MKIGNHELSPEDQERVNSIISNFLGSTHTIIEGKPPPCGRSKSSDKQYVLNVDNTRYVSVKRAYDTPDNIKWELFMSQMRPLLSLPHYKLTKERDFPLPSWRNQEFIIMDWGGIDKRFPISEPRVATSLTENRDCLLVQMGNVAAQNYLFATADRKQEHFVWDIDEKILFSIDHEIPTANNNEVLDYFRNELRLRFGNNWYDNPPSRELFSQRFLAVWSIVEQQKDTIISSYTNHELSNFSNGFSERLTKGSQQALQRIMS